MKTGMKLSKRQKEMLEGKIHCRKGYEASYSAIYKSELKKKINSIISFVQELGPYCDNDSHDWINDLLIDLQTTLKSMIMEN